MSDIIHGFQPVYDANSEVLILGSFPSVKSRQTDFYYGNRQNRFWKMMQICDNLLQICAMCLAENRCTNATIVLCQTGRRTAIFMKKGVFFERGVLGLKNA